MRRSLFTKPHTPDGSYNVIFRARDRSGRALSQRRARERRAGTLIGFDVAAPVALPKGTAILTRAAQGGG
jgi:hypothetical protein